MGSKSSPQAAPVMYASPEEPRSGIWLKPRGPDFMQRVAILVAATVPLLPRPTFNGISALFSPLVAMIVGCCALFFVAGRGQGRHGVGAPVGVVFVAFAATAFYGARVGIQGQAAEIEFVLSRFLMIGYALAICLIAARGGALRVVHYFAVVTVMLSALVLFVGMTGVAFLEQPYPARTLGFSFPWFKTAGVPRSFGEQGIILSIALAYVLVYKENLRPYMRYAMLLACGIIFAMGQSRNMYLATAIVVFAWFFIIKPQRWRALKPFLLASATMTFIIESVMPMLQNSSLGSALIGEGIYERNVEARFDLSSGALALLGSSPRTAVFGWEHMDWQLVAPIETSGGVHNHFLASVLYLGIFAGLLSIWALYVYPLNVVANDLASQEMLAHDSRLREWLATAGAGVLVSLNFYEGFFSLAVGMFIGVAWFCCLKSSSGSVTGCHDSARGRGRRPR